MNLPRCPRSGPALPSLEKIQSLVKRANNYDVADFNKLAHEEMIGWGSKAKTYEKASNNGINQQILLKVRQSADDVIAAKLLFESKTFEIVDNRPVPHEKLRISTFTNIGMISMDGTTGVAFIHEQEGMDYDEALFIPRQQADKLEVFSHVYVTVAKSAL
jgi:hypothetical protein